MFKSIFDFLPVKLVISNFNGIVSNVLRGENCCISV